MKTLSLCLLCAGLAFALCGKLAAISFIAAAMVAAVLYRKES
jgi:hypothetical protein